MTRLFLVEGLPCSGKSTVATHIADKLRESGKKVICIDEGSGSHPADFEFNAYLGEGELSQFSESLQMKIKTSSEKRSNGYIVPLAKFQGEDFNKLLQYKIYDFLPWEVEKPLMLDQWKEFAERHEADSVYVFNCVFLQNPMCETMMRFNFSEEESLEYISSIAKTIKVLDPMVIYLGNDDLIEVIKETEKEREGWLEGVIEYHIHGGYGRSINAQGFEGYIACLKERQKRERSILSKLPVKSLMIDNAHRDWEEAYNLMDRIVSQTSSIP